MRSKAPGSRGLRRFGLLGGESLRRIKPRPRRWRWLAALVENVDNGKAGLPAATAFVEDDAQKADAKGHSGEEQPRQPPQRSSRRQAPTRGGQPDAEETHAGRLRR